MTTSIFIRSYDKDFEWLGYCLKSLQRFATGFHEIVIAVPAQHAPMLKHLTAERVVPVFDDGSNGYLNQMVTKLNADLHTDADFILHCDSDTVIQKPITPETFMEGDKVRWLVSPMEQMPVEVKKAWLAVMVHCLHVWPEYEFMRKATIMVPRWAYGEFRKFVKDLHGYPIDAYIMNRPERAFSEYNCLGLFLYTYFRDKIHWHDCSKDGVPEPWEVQSWSWGGLTPEIREKLEIITA